MWWRLQGFLPLFQRAGPDAAPDDEAGPRPPARDVTGGSPLAPWASARRPPLPRPAPNGERLAVPRLARVDAGLGSRPGLFRSPSRSFSALGLSVRSPRGWSPPGPGAGTGSRPACHPLAPAPRGRGATRGLSHPPSPSPPPLSPFPETRPPPPPPSALGWATAPGSARCPLKRAHPSRPTRLPRHLNSRPPREAPNLARGRPPQTERPKKHSGGPGSGGQAGRARPRRALRHGPTGPAGEGPGPGPGAPGD